MYEHFPTCLILIFLSFVVTCLLLSAWAHSNCRGLKTYMRWFSWMDVTGAQVHVQGQQASETRMGGSASWHVCSPAFPCLLGFPLLEASSLPWPCVPPGSGLLCPSVEMPTILQVPWAPEALVSRSEQAVGSVSLGGHFWSIQLRLGWEVEALGACSVQGTGTKQLF